MNFKRFSFATLAVIFGLYAVAPTVAAVKDWSTVPSTNATADADEGINFAEGQSPGSLNDSMRSLMAVIKGDFANSLVGNGYQKFPNGLIIQWGESNTEAAVTFPTAFPNFVLSVTTGTLGLPAVNEARVTHAGTPTRTGFTPSGRLVSAGGTVAVSVHGIKWMAIGF